MTRSGPTPFGYARRNGRLVPAPDEFKIRIKIYDLFIEHQRKKTVADILNAQGHRTRSGAMFSGQTIGRLLIDESITGVPGKVDAIIGRETFEKCQAILQSQKSKTISRKPRHVFAGLTYCHCGGKMRVPSGSRKYSCTGCREKIYSSDLEAVFNEQLRSAGNTQLQELARKWPDLSLDDKISVLSITTKRIDIDKTNGVIVVTFLDI